MCIIELNLSIFEHVKTKHATFTFAINCMLKGPVTPKDAATAFEMLFIFIRVCALMSCGGVTKVASPE